MVFLVFLLIAGSATTTQNVYRWKETRNVPRLIKALKNEDLIIRARDVQALGEIGDKKAVYPLIEIVKDSSQKDEEMYWYAIEALGEIGDQKAIKYIIPFLTKWETKYISCKALKALSWSPLTETEKVHFWVADKQYTSLIQHRLETISVLKKDIIKEDSREYAVYCMINMGLDEYLSELTHILDKYGSGPMAEVFLNSGNESLIEEGQKWAKKKNLTVMADPEILVFIGQELWRVSPHSVMYVATQSADMELLKTVKWGIWNPESIIHKPKREIKNPRVAFLCTFIESDWMRDCFKACEAIDELGKIGDMDAIPVLLRCLHLAPPMRVYAARALSEITEQNFGEDEQKWRQWWKETQKDER